MRKCKLLCEPPEVRFQTGDDSIDTQDFEIKRIYSDEFYNISLDDPDHYAKFWNFKYQWETGRALPKHLR